MDYVKATQWPRPAWPAVVDVWRGKCSTSRVELRCNHDRKIINDRAAKFRLLFDFITELQFANNAALYAFLTQDLLLWLDLWALQLIKSSLKK